MKPVGGVTPGTTEARGREGPLMACRSLAIGYASRAILPPIDLEIRPGELWAIVGRNGSGKTTWLRTMLGLLPAVTGTVERRSPSLRVSHVPQRTSFDELYPLSAREVVVMGADRGWSFARPRLAEPEVVGRALEDSGAAPLASRMFRSLSEGQKQRVLLARLLASAPDVAFLDEPTAAMDLVAEREALAVLSAVRQKYGMAIVVVTHGLAEIRAHADHALLLDRDAGEVAVGSIEEVLARASSLDSTRWCAGGDHGG